jgi:benzoyl-CoA reductase/2-hydroxyglutaryl-CoA dehydratase subunit BcrC/BadD/HgdB
VRSFIRELEALSGVPVTDAALARSIALFNENRGLLRRLFEDRRSGNARLTSTDLQALVKSSMVMDKAEHTVLLRQVLAGLEAVPRDERIRLYLSGRLCHAPHPELLQAIEECGAIVVDNDLYTGARYISTDVREGIDPVEAITEWYLMLPRHTAAPDSLAQS